MSESENFIHNKYGYCYYDIGFDEPIIYNLYIEPEYRRKGKATELLHLIINEIKKTGYKGNIRIEVQPKENDIDYNKLLHFYKSMNLKVI